MSRLAKTGFAAVAALVVGVTCTCLQASVACAEPKVLMVPANSTTPQGLLGIPLEAALDTDFYTFFRLEEVFRETDLTARDVVVFKPTGDDFRKLVTVRTTLAKDSTVASLELLLARSFIDEPSQRPFVNDIATSFLRGAPSPTDRPALASLAAEIRHRVGPSVETLFLGAARSAPTLPKEPSPGFEVYVGTRDSYTMKLRQATLVMKRVEQDGKAWLQMSLSRRH